MLPPRRDLPFSKPVTKKSHSTTVTKTAQECRDGDSFSNSESNKPSKDPEPVPPNPALEPDNGPGFLESQSQILSQPAPFPQASQQLILHEEPPVSSQIPLHYGPIEHMPQVPSVQNTVPANHNSRNPNSFGGSEDKQGQIPVPHTVAAITEDQLAEYLASPTSERIAFLENWMCGLIEDDKFMTLCQDVEGTWRRFAFGQKQ